MIAADSSTPAAPRPPMQTVLEILKKTTDYFAAKGVDNPRLNAEWLVGHALGLKRMQLYMQFERELAEPELEKIRPLVRRRASREPLQYILGETPFSGLTLKCDRRALIPRPETELLIELIGERLKDAPPARILDLGTGTGAIGLALAKSFPNASVTAVDSSAEALALAAYNAQLNGLAERVRFVQSDWLGALPPGETFDLIVANPPYLTDQEVAEAAPEVRSFEPHSALVSPDDGLADLRKILRSAPARMEPNGMIALETGIAQHALLNAFCGEVGLDRFESCRDLTGRDRFVFARRPV